MVLRFNERVGTNSADFLIGLTGTVTYGLAGNDTMTSSIGSEFSILIGGSGDDAYESRPDTAITVADNGFSRNDVLVTESLSPSSNSVTAVIDGRHFVAYNVDLNETVFVLDFLSDANYVETVVTPEGNFSSVDLFSFATQQRSYLGDLDWEELPLYGFNHPFSTRDTNEAITFYEDRADALEGVPPVDDDDDVVLPPGQEDVIYRFFNADTGTHFYTASVEERDAVARNLPNFSYEGGVFGSADEGVDVYRFFNSQTGVHFYTADAGERDAVLRSGGPFSYEGVAYEAYNDADIGLAALYRFYNTQTGAHFYTASETERDDVALSLPQFSYEGIAYYVEIL